MSLVQAPRAPVCHFPRPPTESTRRWGQAPPVDDSLSRWTSSQAARRSAAAVLAGAVALLVSPLPRAQGPLPRPAISVSQGADGRLVYAADPSGNTVVDFSYAGYEGGGKAIPDVPARIAVTPGGGTDDRQRIQTAIDLVTAMPADSQGFRGAVLLERGTYAIDGELRVAASGVVVRGAGAGEDGTVLVASGTSRRSLIVVSGTGDRQEVAASRRVISDRYVPVGARRVVVEDATGFHVGDRVIVTRPSTAEWISLLGMNTFQGWRPESRLHWQPGSRDITWDRVVTAVDGSTITVDAPLTTALDAKYGVVSSRSTNSRGASRTQAWRICASCPRTTRRARRMKTMRGSPSRWTRSRTRGCAR